MINEEKLNKMYDGIIDGCELTTKELNGYGFNTYDLSNLVDNGILERMKKGHYSICSVDGLFFYGRKLLSMEEYERAVVCFEKCYEINPNHLGVNYQLFLRSIERKNYSKVFEYFEKICNTDNKYYMIDNNYFLYLLSMIVELPDHYREYAKSLKFEDMKIGFSDEKYGNSKFLDDIRQLSFDQKFNLALKQFNDLLKKKNSLRIQDFIIKTLLSQALEVQNEMRNYIIGLIHEKRYEDVIEYLEKVQECHRLNTFYKYVLFLARDLVEMRKTGIILEKQICKTGKIKFYDAIESRDYTLAFTIFEKHIEKCNIAKNAKVVNDNVIYLLLEEIINNMSFYKNRVKKGDKTLILAPKRKK